MPLWSTIIFLEYYRFKDKLLPVGLAVLLKNLDGTPGAPRSHAHKARCKTTGRGPSRWCSCANCKVLNNTSHKMRADRRLPVRGLRMRRSTCDE